MEREQQEGIFPHLVVKILAYIPVKCNSFPYKYQWGVICISTT